MNTCLREETLQAYLDGELATGWSEAARVHLARCVVCDRQARVAKLVLDRISDELKCQLDIAVPTERLRERIDNQLALAQAARVSRRITYPYTRDIGLVAACLIAAIAFAVAYRDHGRTIPVDRTAAGGSVVTDSHELVTTEETDNDAAAADRQDSKQNPVSRRRSNGRLIALGIGSDFRGDTADPFQGEYFFDIETAKHLEKAEVLLRSFDNTSFSKSGELAYEKEASKHLLYNNILLRREAENAENAPARDLLGNLEPLLLDISNLPDRPRTADVVSVKERIRTSDIVTALQVYSTRITTLD